MGMRAMIARRCGLLLVAMCCSLPALADWIDGRAFISGGGFTVTSTGWVRYDCECLFAHTITGSHVINDGAAGTIASKTFGPMNGNYYVTEYDGSVSAGTIYSHCYRGRLSATGSGGASNEWGSAQWCAPADPNTLCNQSCWTVCKNGVCPPQQDIEWCTPYCSPLVLDLAGNGIRTSGAEDPVQFDIDADGDMDMVGWLARGGDDAFLWRDLENNHRVDDGGELFGQGMTLPDGGRAENGFAALAAYDSNGDGAIDREDAIWHRLRLWVDANHNGFSEAAELQPIDASCVQSLGLQTITTGYVDPAGNQFRLRSTYDCGRKTTDARELTDVYFRVFH
jgi:hypothetical protein